MLNLNKEEIEGKTGAKVALGKGKYVIATGLLAIVIFASKFGFNKNQTSLTPNQSVNVASTTEQAIAKSKTVNINGVEYPVGYQFIIEADTEIGTFTLNGREFHEGQTVTIDGEEYTIGSKLIKQAAIKHTMYKVPEELVEQGWVINGPYAVKGEEWVPADVVVFYTDNKGNRIDTSECFRQEMVLISSDGTIALNQSELIFQLVQASTSRTLK